MEYPVFGDDGQIDMNMRKIQDETLYLERQDNGNYEGEFKVHTVTVGDVSGVKKGDKLGCGDESQTVFVYDWIIEVDQS